jgi:REP element-mobilizing transposase RayT
MIDNFRFYQERGDFIILAYVIMPNHFHVVLNTKDKISISKCIGNLKRITSRSISARLREIGDLNTLNILAEHANNESSKDCRVWKPRFDCFVINNENTLRLKIEYVHFNPVRKGLVANAADWPYSSAGNYAGVTNGAIVVDNKWRCLGYDDLPSGKGS